MEITVGRKGNQKIAITDATVSRVHCTLTEQADGTFILENKSQNGTFVDGHEIVRSTVTRDTVIQLGASYQVKVADLIPDQQPPVDPNPYVEPKKQPYVKPQNPQEPPTYSLRTLKLVHEEYQNTLEEIKQKQKKIQNLRMIAPIFTMGSGVLSFMQPGAGIPLVVIGLGLTLYAFYKASKDDSDDLRKKALDKYLENYVCPNPKCNHTLSQSPKVLLINKSCPFCKCKFTE